VKYDKPIRYRRHSRSLGIRKAKYKPLQALLSTALGENERNLADLIKGGPQYAREILMAIVLAEGRKLLAILKEMGIAEIMIDICNQDSPDSRFRLSHLKGIVANTKIHKRKKKAKQGPNDYLNPLSISLIKLILSDKPPGEQYQFMKDIMQSIPDGKMGLYAKKRILTEINPHYANCISSPAYTELPSALSDDFTAAIKVSTVEKLLELELDESEFILLARSQIHVHDSDADALLASIDTNYFNLNYEACLALIEEYLTAHPDFPNQSNLLAEISLLNEVDGDENQSRFYFETKLTQYYWGNVSREDVAGIQRISTFIQAKFGVGMDISPETDPETLARTVLTLCDTDALLDASTMRKVMALKENSVVYQQLARTFRDGVFPRHTLARHPDADLSQIRGRETEKQYSHQLGLMRANDPYYRDEISTKTQVNRSADVHAVLEEAEHAWPLENPRVPSVASLCGHLFSIVCMLENYMRDNASSPTLTADINDFLRATLFAYINEGLHSYHEMFAVLRDPLVTELFDRYNMTIDIAIPEKRLVSPMEHAAQYTCDYRMKQQLGRELQSRQVTEEAVDTEVDVAPDPIQAALAKRFTTKFVEAMQQPDPYQFAAWASQHKYTTSELLPNQIPMVETLRQIWRKQGTEKLRQLLSVRCLESDRTILHYIVTRGVEADKADLLTFLSELVSQQNNSLSLQEIRELFNREDWRGRSVLDIMLRKSSFQFGKAFSDFLYSDVLRAGNDAWDYRRGGYDNELLEETISALKLSEKPSHQYEPALKNLQRQWRRRNRVRWHRKLFGETVTTTENVPYPLDGSRSPVWAKAKALCDALEADLIRGNTSSLLFATTKHHSPAVARIMATGVIYSSDMAKARCFDNKTGVSSQFSVSVGDAGLVCTAPFSVSHTLANLPFIELDLTAIAKDPVEQSVLFKLQDWHHFGTSREFTFVPGINLRCNAPQSDLTTTSYQFIKDGQVLATIQIPTHLEVYHGLRGLHAYVLAHIFRLVDALKYPYPALYDEIMDALAKAAIREDQLKDLLLSIAKRLCLRSEIDFIGLLVLTEEMVVQAVKPDRRDRLSYLKDTVIDNLVTFLSPADSMCLAPTNKRLFAYLNDSSNLSPLFFSTITGNKDRFVYIERFHHDSNEAKKAWHRAYRKSLVLGRLGDALDRALRQTYNTVGSLPDAIIAWRYLFYRATSEGIMLPKTASYLVFITSRDADTFPLGLPVLACVTSVLEKILMGLHQKEALYTHPIFKHVMRNTLELVSMMLPHGPTVTEDMISDDNYIIWNIRDRDHEKLLLAYLPEELPDLYHDLKCMDENDELSTDQSRLFDRIKALMQENPTMAEGDHENDNFSDQMNSLFNRKHHFAVNLIELSTQLADYQALYQTEEKRCEIR